MQSMMGPNGENACATPETFGPDPNFRTVKVPDTKAYGIDIDGQDSRAKGKPAPGTCAHNDLVGMNGEHGVDNQFFRVVGCSNSYQSTGSIQLAGRSRCDGRLGHPGSRSTESTTFAMTTASKSVFRECRSHRAQPESRALAERHLRGRSGSSFPGQDARPHQRRRADDRSGDCALHKITNSIYLERPLNDARCR